MGSGATQEGCHFNHGDQAEIIPELRYILFLFILYYYLFIYFFYFFIFRSALDNNGLSYMDISSSDENTYDISRLLFYFILSFLE